jgi:hypothetical protein
MLALSMGLIAISNLPMCAQAPPDPATQAQAIEVSPEAKAAAIIERLAKENPLNNKEAHASVLTLRQYYSPRGNANGECFGSARPAGLTYWRSGFGSTFIKWAEIESYCKEPGPCCVLVFSTKKQAHAVRYYPNDYAWVLQILEQLNIPQSKDC